MTPSQIIFIGMKLRALTRYEVPGYEDIRFFMAAMATQVNPFFAVAVALTSHRTPPGPANPASPTARAVKAFCHVVGALGPRFCS